MLLYFPQDTPVELGPTAIMPVRHPRRPASLANRSVRPCELIVLGLMGAGEPVPAAVRHAAAWDE